MQNLKALAEASLAANIYNSKKGGDFFGDGKICRIRKELKGRMKGECELCCSDGYRLNCGHACCSDCLLDHVWHKIREGKSLTCFQCSRVFTTKEVIEFGLPSELEMKFLSIAVSLNAVQCANYIQCPNCFSFVERISDDHMELFCQVCKSKAFCWECKKPWMNPGSHIICGNPDCPTTIKEKTLITNALQNTAYVVKGTVNIPKTRMCPNCKSIVEWLNACNSVTCKCGQIFCIICLAKALPDKYSAACGSVVFVDSSGDNRKCQVAPIQKP